ncbi:PREDICTED: anamorsin homolog [Diuraphis noxia]|uniref:anamorsin homolog n=1 Tax=Diuraphis noxia TaxID=143948 RepID=UPI000763999D|nr:PREDICTED: anamorsin homolog [Diuraphis noxia]
MDNHHIKVDLLKLLDDNHLTVAQGTSDRKNVLFVVGKPSAVKKLEEFTTCYADRINMKIATVEYINLATELPLYNAILSGFGVDDKVSCDLVLLPTYIALLAAGGALIAKTEEGTEDMLVKHMKLYGFLNVTIDKSIPGVVIGNMPMYKVGSSDKIALNPEVKENVISAWKLEDNNSETISEDDLLEADDLKKPDSSSLRVCATTKKAKACKDCSCGLAEELEANRLKDTPKPDTSNAKSSCGSCYLGDAFRCASCPYLGMPAFKPGEKVQLAGNLLQDDF